MKQLISPGTLKKKLANPKQAEDGKRNEFRDVPLGLVVNLEHDQVLIPVRVDHTNQVGGDHGTKEGAEHGLHWEVIACLFQ